MAHSFAAARRWGCVVPAHREGAPRAVRQSLGARKETSASRIPSTVSAYSSHRPEERLRLACVFRGPKSSSSIATASAPASRAAMTAFSRSNGCNASPQSMIRASAASMTAQPDCFAGSMPRTINGSPTGIEPEPPAGVRRMCYHYTKGLTPHHGSTNRANSARLTRYSQIRPHFGRFGEKRLATHPGAGRRAAAGSAPEPSPERPASGRDPRLRGRGKLGRRLPSLPHASGLSPVRPSMPVGGAYGSSRAPSGVSTGR